MPATIRIGDSTATLTDGQWQSDNLELRDMLTDTLRRWRKTAVYRLSYRPYPDLADAADLAALLGGELIESTRGDEAFEYPPDAVF